MVLLGEFARANPDGTIIVIVVRISTIGVIPVPTVALSVATCKGNGHGKGKENNAILQHVYVGHIAIILGKPRYRAGRWE